MSKQSDKVRVEAKRYHTYQGKEYSEGDMYQADAQDAVSLAAQGMATSTDEAVSEDVEDSPKPESKTDHAKRKDMTVSESPADAAKGKYDRRDVKAK